MRAPMEIRSPAWPGFARRYKRKHPACEACGKRRSLLRQIDVHHIIPVHVDNRLELVESNLISLCRGLFVNNVQHHLLVGHNGSWRSWNPSVRADAAMMLAGRASL